MLNDYRASLRPSFLDMDYPDVDIVTVTHNSARHLKSFFEGLDRLNYPAECLRLTVVDNASRDDTRERLTETASHLPFELETIQSQVNEGFAAACNRGAGCGTAPFILFLNPDAVPEPTMLKQLMDRLLREDNVGLADAAQEPIDIPKWRDSRSGDTDWCSGAALLVRRSAFEQLDGFDSFFFLYAEDVDLSWRMWLAGWRCVYERSARVHHNTAPPGTIKSIETRFAIRYSFAMRLIYGDRSTVITHFIRGLRYLVSPRTSLFVRKAIVDGFWTSVRGAKYLLRRRRAAQAALREVKTRDRFVFNEWYYGRWQE
jgi:GT2 family glycosyltransferase